MTRTASHGLLTLVLVLAAALPAAGRGIGINLGGFNDQGGAYVDYIQNISRYSAVDGSAFVRADLDANGWPMADFKMTIDNRPVPEWTGVIDDPEEYRVDYSGLYKGSFTGQATIEYVKGDWHVENQLYDSNANVTTFDLVVDEPGPEHQRITWNFIDTQRTAGDPLGSCITDLRVTRPGYAHDTDQLFTDAFMNAFTQVPWADWRYQTNAAHPYPDTQEWSERKRATDCGALWQLDDGKLESLPWEHVVALSNEANVSPWISIPMSASPDYITQLATLLRDELNPNLEVYVEMANEVWNGGFESCTWNNAEASAMGLSSENNYARRTVEAAQIFESVFGAGSLNDRVRAVLCWHQPLQQWDVIPMLQYIDSTYGEPKDLLYAVASQTYFSGNGLNGSAGTDTWTIEQILDAAHYSIISQMDGSSGSRPAWVNMANGWDLPGGYCSYEGGPGFGIGELRNIANRILAHRDERMRDEMMYNLKQAFFILGGNILNQFTLSSDYCRYGCWGLTDDLNDPDRNYKYQAIREIFYWLNDYNTDGEIDDLDIDALLDEIAAGTDSAVYDVNSDGDVDEDDAIGLIGLLIGTVRGDATLDGAVDAADLSLLAANWNLSGRAWATADFTGEGDVDAADLSLLAANWQWTSPAAGAPLPEPASLALLVAGGAALLRRRRANA